MAKVDQGSDLFRGSLVHGSLATPDLDGIIERDHT